jgi:rhodanese-related sulfurtransferase
MMKMPLLTVILLALLLNGCGGAPSTDVDSAVTMQAKRIAAGEDHISAAELADRLIRDQRDFELVDIREEADFAAGHIESARHIPLAGLLAADSLDSLPAGRTIVVYSNGSAHAAQAALLLNLTGRDALALLGGYNYWQAYLHDPEKAGVAEMDRAERARYQAVACRFAGEYVAEAGLPPQASEQPEKPAPAAAGQEADPLGLGLGLGSEQVRDMELQESAQGPAEDDPLGLGLGLGSEQVRDMNLQESTPGAAEPDPLGLGLGLGGDAGKSASEPASRPEGETQRLLIRAEC